MCQFHEWRSRQKIKSNLAVFKVHADDVGLLRYDAQVNNQNVFGTLMNIADNPNRVSIAQIWRENDVIGRVPIIVTGKHSPLSFYATSPSAVSASACVLSDHEQCTGMKEPACCLCFCRCMSLVTMSVQRTPFPCCRQRFQHAVCAADPRRAHDEVLLAAQPRGPGQHPVPDVQGALFSYRHACMQPCGQRAWLQALRCNPTRPCAARMWQGMPTLCARNMCKANLDSDAA